jgi:ribosome-binding factor A
MSHFTRADRVSGLIQKTLSDILQKQAKDPRLAMTTITNVKMSRDLRLARIYFSTPGGEKRNKAAAQGFESALGFFKRTLASQLGLRYMPDIKFYYDESFDYGSHIDKLLSHIKRDNGSNSTPSNQQ